MKAFPTIAVILGMAAIVALIAYFGAGGVVRALAAVGWTGLLAVCLIHLAMMAVMGVAWGSLLPQAPLSRAIWARLVRDAGSEVLPLSQVGGYVLGARALAVSGIPVTQAAASTIVDVTLEFLAQLAYTALSLGWLVHLRPNGTVALPGAIGLGVATLAAVGFVILQRHGVRFFDRCARWFGGGGWAERTAAGAAALHAALDAIYRRRSGLWTNFTLHLASWVASAAESWVVLLVAGRTLPFGTVMIIESLLYAMRSAAFVIPNAVGVQEGAYVLLGTGFGLTPEMALALSLIKRARDLAIGLPTLGAWQLFESGRLWRRRTVARRFAEPDNRVPSE